MRMCEFGLARLTVKEPRVASDHSWMEHRACDHSVLDALPCCIYALPIRKLSRIHTRTTKICRPSNLVSASASLSLTQPSPSKKKVSSIDRGQPRETPTESHRFDKRTHRAQQPRTIGAPPGDLHLGSCVGLGHFRAGQDRRGMRGDEFCGEGIGLIHVACG
ncbi:hypothetical protein K491DRAFT_690423, partial [Lophiostoma macrostomum CBS 122681]